MVLPPASWMRAIARPPSMISIARGESDGVESAVLVEESNGLLLLYRPPNPVKICASARSLRGGKPTSVAYAFRRWLVCFRDDYGNEEVAAIDDNDPLPKQLVLNLRPYCLGNTFLFSHCGDLLVFDAIQSVMVLYNSDGRVLSERDVAEDALVGEGYDGYCILYQPDEAPEVLPARSVDKGRRLKVPALHSQMPVGISKTADESLVLLYDDEVLLVPESGMTRSQPLDWAELAMRQMADYLPEA